jgi:hypothetical protein
VSHMSSLRLRILRQSAESGKVFLVGYSRLSYNQPSWLRSVAASFARMMQDRRGDAEARRFRERYSRRGEGRLLYAT